MKVVEIVWMDACIEEAHIPMQSAEAVIPLERRNCGYLINSDDDKVTISYGTIENAYKGEQAYDLVLSIPKGMVKEIREL